MLLRPTMLLVQVKKVVAVCFNEAAKLTLEQLGQHRLERSQQDLAVTADLPRIYGDLRRLRDFLQRCASAHQDTVELELSPADAGLLVACCRRAVEAIELRLEGQAVLADERKWLQKKLQVLGDWAVELAAKPLLDLPLARLSTKTTEGVRALTVRLQNKVYGDVNLRAKIVAPGSTQRLAQGIAAPIGNEPVPPSPSGGQSAAADCELAATAADGPLFEHTRIHDPRLRSLAGMELRSYEHAVQAGDHRLATVLLTAVLECALLDHAIPRRSELDLHGTPDTWNLQELLLRALGDQAEPKDAALAYHLFSARNLLRPALQMVTPAVVTAASYERLREFVSRTLHCLGYGLKRETLPPGAMQASDFLTPSHSTR